MAVKLISLGKIFTEDIKFEEINCDDEDIIKLEYVTKYHVNLKTAKTSIARTYEDLNEMTVTLEIPKSDYNNESFKKLLEWSSLPVQDENYYRDLAINMIIAGENEKTVLFSHGRITVDVKHNTKADYVTVEIMVKQKEDMYRGVVFGLELYETYRDARDKVDNPLGINVVVPVIIVESLWDEEDNSSNDIGDNDKILNTEREFAVQNDAGSGTKPSSIIDATKVMNAFIPYNKAKYATQWFAIDRINSYYSSKPKIKNHIDEKGISIFAFEGAGDYAVGNSNNQHPSGRYGAMMVVMKGKEVKYITRNASTLPDLYPGPIEWKSSTVVTDGIYDYWTGTHNDAYTALVSGNKNAWYYDRNKITNNKKGFFGGLANGINIHAGGDANISTDEALSWSQGCQIIWYADYVNFGKNVGFLKNSAEPIKGNTSGHMAALGVDHTLHINVLYIIDRTFMPDSYYGKFLPEKPKK